MSVPKYELVKGLDGTDDVLYNGSTIRIHQVSFTEPDDPMGQAIMHLNYDVIDGDPVEDADFRNALGEIAFDVLEKNVALRELKAEIKERRSGT
jgi:hypothetical protein